MPAIKAPVAREELPPLLNLGPNPEPKSLVAKVFEYSRKLQTVLPFRFKRGMRPEKDEVVRLEQQRRCIAFVFSAACEMSGFTERERANMLHILSPVIKQNLSCFDKARATISFQCLKDLKSLELNNIKQLCLNIRAINGAVDFRVEISTPEEHTAIHSIGGASVIGREIERQLGLNFMLQDILKK